MNYFFDFLYFIMVILVLNFEVFGLFVLILVFFVVMGYIMYFWFVCKILGNWFFVCGFDEIEVMEENVVNIFVV